MSKIALPFLCVFPLICSSAVVSANNIDLNIGGYMAMYTASVDQGEVDGNSVNEIDLIRDTEIHLVGKTLLDNGLTVGARVESYADPDDSMKIDASHIFFENNYGHVDVGAQDGVAFLLQVAVPCGDSVIDGFSTYVQPVNYSAATSGKIVSSKLDYVQKTTSKKDKITYISPLVNGFQGGFSYVFDYGYASDDGTGVRIVSEPNEYQEAYEAAFRYSGDFYEVNYKIGGGYSLVKFDSAYNSVSPAAKGDITDDRDVYNVALDLNYNDFGLGVVYQYDDLGERYQIKEAKTFSVGADYTQGKFKYGVSYLKDTRGLAGGTDFVFKASSGTVVEKMESERYTAGVVYNMSGAVSLRGSLQYIEHEFSQDAGINDFDATSLMFGTLLIF